MSDYLTRLAATLLNRAPVIQPRLASRFESTRRAAALPSLDAIQETVVESDPQIEPSAPQPASVAEKKPAQHPEPTPRLPSPLRAGEIKVEENDETAAHLESSRASASADDSIHARNGENAAREITETEQLVAQFKPRDVGRIRNAATPPNSDTRLIISPSPQPAVEQRDQPIPLVAEPMLQRILSEGDTRSDPTLIRQPSPQWNELSRAAASIVAQPQVTRAGESNRVRTTDPKSSQASAPTIRVTIGRIEVRSLLPTPPPPVERVTLPAPKMSLEDYLRAQHGDRR